MGSTNKDKPPLAPDMDVILNRISMGISRHGLLSSTLKKTADSDSSKSSPTTTKKGFSSLAATPTTTSVPKQLSYQQEPPARTSGRKADLDAISEEPPNAGLGWVPPKSATSALGGLADDRKLRSQILGRGANGRKGGESSEKQMLARKKRREVNESESEEDVGRSALGRGKKRKTTGDGGVSVGVSVEGVDSGVSEDKVMVDQAEVVVSSGDDAVQKLEEKKEQKKVDEEGAMEAKKNEQNPSHTPRPIPVTTPQESKEGDAERESKKKRKRERNKKNRKMKEVSKGEGEVAEV